MNFMGLPERINKLLYHRQVGSLTQREAGLAKVWTLELIRDSHPKWTEQQIESYYNNLVNIRVVAVDQWGKRNGV
ncbi:MAG: hypothetical protein SH807_08525 [Blastochloris sp.]|jgi:hypothetical protein|nr:hypothetical protein [Blastochloris sp.]